MDIADQEAIVDLTHEVADEEKHVVMVWSNRSEAGYAFETTGAAELRSLVERVIESGTHDITSIVPLNGAELFATGLEIGGELW